MKFEDEEVSRIEIPLKVDELWLDGYPAAGKVDAASEVVVAPR